MKKQILGMVASVGAVAVLMPLAAPTAAVAIPTNDELKDHAYTVGRTMRYYDCWDGKGRVYLQAKPHGKGKWKTVASAKTKRNTHACHRKKYPYRAVFKWRVNAVGAPGTADRATVLPMREAVKRSKGKGLKSAWRFTQKIYRNEADRQDDYCQILFGTPC